MSCPCLSVLTEHILFLSGPFASLIIFSGVVSRIFREFSFVFLLILLNVHGHVVVVMEVVCPNCHHCCPNRIDSWYGFGFEFEVELVDVSVRLFLFQLMVE